ncbi:MAG: ATP-binding protein, partial [Deltaproteobacteria bacterium]|nr:ATP-binding protein [Deltaproteobacteria bacterium]
MPEKHYMLPVLPRLPGVDEMIANENYFILHAPRQSGKTTFIKSLINHVNSGLKYYALYFSLETLEDIVEDNEAMTRIADEINRSLKMSGLEVLKK